MLRQLHAFCIRCQPVNIVVQSCDGEVIFRALFSFVLRVQAGQVRADVSRGRSLITSQYKGTSMRSCPLAFLQGPSGHTAVICFLMPLGQAWPPFDLHHPGYASATTAQTRPGLHHPDRLY